DTMKSYCPTTTPDMYGRYDMGYSSFDDKYHLWKMPSGSIAALRDLECYCKSTGMCPFEK
ncbi:hypothetical protein KAH37_08855, partial [bacterium]|nr:hypothetical protein [bacterium]